MGMLLKKIIDSKWVQRIGLAIASAVLVGVYSFLYVGSEGRIFTIENKLAATDFLILNQPDESINFLFIRQLVLYGSVHIPAAFTELTHNQVHPRSVTIVENNLVPIAFPGLFLSLGIVARLFVFIFGSAIFLPVAILLTPVFAVLGIWLWWFSIRSLVNRKVAIWSALALTIQPAWWYYASRPFQANTLFVVLLLTALVTGISAFKKRKLFLFFLSGLFVGLAIMVRPMEITWILLLLIALGLHLRKQVSKQILFSFLSGLIVGGIILLTGNYLVYGNPLATGYAVPHDQAAGLITEHPAGRNMLQALFLPFGFHPVTILKTAYHYTFKLFPAWTLVAVLGLAWFYIKEKIHRPIFYYASGISLYLLLWYGSWQFTDNLAGVISIGSSQVRYFLPLFVFSTLGVGYFLSRLWHGNKILKCFTIIFSITLALISFQSVFVSFEGLLPVKNTVANYYDWREQVYTKTPVDAVIVTRYADKYLFPGRQIIPGFVDPQSTAAVLSLLREHTPVFWYDPKLSKIELEKINQQLAYSYIAIGEPVLIIGGLELREINMMPSLD